MIEKNSFGLTAGGEPVTEYVIKNESIELHCINLGCIVNKLIVADKDGVLRDVVLGQDNLADCEKEADTYMGAVVGRVANRIENAEFVLNGKKYKLDKNDGENCLHGGKKGLNRKVFSLEKQTDNSLTFSAVCRSEEDGFPGALSVKVTYALIKNKFSVTYEAVCDEDCPVSLTNHSYFNLSAKPDITDHLLTINSDFITPVNNKLIPTGEFMSVEGSPFDFKNGARIGKGVNAPHRQLLIAGGYDHNYVLKNYNLPEKVASLYAPDTCILMDVFTNAPGIQVYSGNFLNGNLGKYGQKYSKRAGVCLETQGFPNAVNCISFPSVLLKAGNTYKSVTEFSFYVAQQV